MAATYRDYSPFYNSVFSVMAEDGPSILFVSCTVTSIECNVLIILNFQIIYIYKTYGNLQISV